MSFPWCRSLGYSWRSPEFYLRKISQCIVFQIRVGSLNSLSTTLTFFLSLHLAKAQKALVLVVIQPVSTNTSNVREDSHAAADRRRSLIMHCSPVRIGKAQVDVGHLDDVLKVKHQEAYDNGMVGGRSGRTAFPSPYTHLRPGPAWRL